MSKKSTLQRGRKKTDDPKEIVRLYVNRSVIKKLGGVESIRELAYLSINEKVYPIR